MRKLSFLVLITLICSVLSGCLYPEAQKADSQVSNDEQLKAVQKAVDQYKKANKGLLPIKTKPENTPVYMKYLIDFHQLKAPKTDLAAPPANAYESGGVYQYVIIDAEKNPVVKVFDVRIPEKIRELEIRIRSQGYPPFKKELARNVYTLDFKKLGYQTAPKVISPYSGRKLPFVVTGKGEIYVDYSKDLKQALEHSTQNFKAGEDIRSLLTENTPYVPAYSLPYTVNRKNEPVFMAK
ncbi:hypothetical protein [Heyndrickxia acidiproducens]|uniref:hypothetical protein n=1 Tax=Heyndrickxia acidiproducens TaxID=1121084 RepID=UPI00047677AA|nr:hypothetical protein [Heyndrickxia acidiproducens]